MSNHSPEPWRVEKWTNAGEEYVTFVDANGQEVIQDGGDSQARLDDGEPLKPSEADAERIVACINACAGLSNGELQERGIRLLHMTAAE